MALSETAAGRGRPLVSRQQRADHQPRSTWQSAEIFRSASLSILLGTWYVSGDVKSDQKAALVERFDAFFLEHRLCEGLEGGVLELTENGLLWGVAWIVCAGCGVRWEWRLAS